MSAWRIAANVTETLVGGDQLPAAELAPEVARLAETLESAVEEDAKE